MYNTRKKIDSHGFTLIEIVASLAILGMLLAAFLPVFPQLFSWTNQTSEELTASNLLNEAVTSIKKNENELYNCLKTADLPSCMQKNSNMIKQTYRLNDKTYNVNYVMNTTDEEKKLGLYRVHASITESGEVKSDTYLYLGPDVKTTITASKEADQNEESEEECEEEADEDCNDIKEKDESVKDDSKDKGKKKDNDNGKHKDKNKHKNKG